MDPRIEASLSLALATTDFNDLLERAAPGLGMPGIKPHLELARELGRIIARDRKRGLKLAIALGRSEREEARIVAAAAFAALAAGGSAGSDPLGPLQELADDVRNTVRIAVIDAVRLLLTTDLPGTLLALQAWTDGFLQAHIALEALMDRQILATVTRADALLALLDPAFALADTASRAADRWQGVRVLRQGFPAQITAFVARFSEIFGWLLEHAAATRPETREVLEKTAEALLRAQFRKSEVESFRAALTKSAKPPRDPSRIVHGTRKRSKH